MNIWSRINYPQRILFGVDVPTETGLRQRDGALIHERDNSRIQVR